MAQPCFLRDLRLEKTLAWLRKRKRPPSGDRFGCARRRLAALLRVPLSPALAVIVLMLAMLFATFVMTLVVALIMVTLVVVRRACARGRCGGRRGGCCG